MNCRDRVFGGVMVALMLLIGGCGGRKAGSPQDSALKDNVYTNRFFNFAVQIPDTWTVLKKPTPREMQAAAEAMSGGNKQAASTALRSMTRVHCLLLARNVVVGMSISVTAENLANAPEVNSGEDYLDHALDLITGPGKSMERVGQITPVQLYGREFHRVELTGGFMGVRQHQAMFVRLEKKHALIFVLTAKSPQAVEEAMAMVRMNGQVEQIARTAIAPTTSKNVRKVAARESGKKEGASAKPPTADADWVSAIRLQGVGGTSKRRLAIINGKTLAPGDGAQVMVGKKSVVIRCVAVRDNSATITVDGIDGERELRLN